MRIGTWNMAGWLAEAGVAGVVARRRLRRVAADRSQRERRTARLSPASGPGAHGAASSVGRRLQPVAAHAPARPSRGQRRAAAVVAGVTYCSTILPWRGSGGEPTWPGAELPRDQHSGRMRFALETLLSGLSPTDLVWGGDWNQALDGPESTGSRGGRRHLLAAIDKLGLQVPTADLPHRLDGHLSIDHIGVPRDRRVIGVEHRTAVGLSDHDCYVVEVEPTLSWPERLVDVADVLDVRRSAWCCVPDSRSRKVSVAGSIGDWFAHRERWAGDYSPDDEYGEPLTAAWDVHPPQHAAPRQTRQRSVFQERRRVCPTGSGRRQRPK